MSRSLSQEIISRWEHGFKKVGLSGLNPSARAFTIAQLLISTDRRIAVICPDVETASRMHQDIRTFLRLLGDDSLGSMVDHLWGWEHSPFSSFNPSIKNRIRRLRALSRVRMGITRALVGDVRAFAQTCPSLTALDAGRFTLAPNDQISREELILRLDSSGYIRNDPVEDPGAYTVRGGIFDIFSSAASKPYRLDFFDDVLESIKHFDPNTQRSFPEPLERIVLFPISEVVVSDESLGRAKSRIKAFCDEFGIPKRARDEFFERLDTGFRDPLLDYLAPYFAQTEWGFVTDLMEGEWSLAISDSLGVDSAYDELIGELKSGFQTTLESGGIVTPWDKLYARPEKFQDALRTLTSLEMDEIALGVPAPTEQTDEDSSEDVESAISDKLHVKLFGNADIKIGDGKQRPAYDGLLKRTKAWSQQGYVRVFMGSTASQAERMSFLLSQKQVACRIAENVSWSDTENIQIVEGTVSGGFRLPRYGLAIVTDSELFGPKKPAQKARPSKALPEVGMGSFVSSLEDLESGDLIVHHHHGIGRYRGLAKLDIDRVQQDFLLLEYAGTDKLYLPVYRLDQVQRYIGPQEGLTLDKLGSVHFEKAKAKVKAELQDLAHELLALYAKRTTRQGFAYTVPAEEYGNFEARFPYAETSDQLKAIEDTLADLQSERIMDRLVCGDVGYGKTEVAMRAAFLAAANGKQVAVLVPTTVLALQHERSFRDRFKDAPLPINIGVLSRFKAPSEVKQTLAELREGRLDIVIGTHRLLSRDVAFKDLGLIIVDEEQRFGVEHKERLKRLRVNTDVLTLTATPIPRTLQMSLMGVRDISIINTPPVDRLSIRTYVARFEEDVISKAIRQELARGGQVFFIHNRVQSINAMADRLRTVVPDAKIIIAHGQLTEGELEKRMLDFYSKKGNVLLCSTIIESGLDIPSANTMIINRADMFGLAQLYQLRGRVGRSQLRAYCYLLLPEEGSITDDAKKRLEVIQRFVDLGSGFKIASHDLELRGGGDILGKSQSGHIAAVGFELYTELLDEAVRELRGEHIEDRFDPEIKLPVAALLPEGYVPDVHQRLGLYKRLSQSNSSDALHEIELELQDRYGKPPAEVQNLIWLIRIKQLLRQYHIKSLVAGSDRLALEIGEGARVSPEKALALVQGAPQTYSVTPDSKVVIKRQFRSAHTLFEEVEKLLGQVADHSAAC